MKTERQLSSAAILAAFLLRQGGKEAGSKFGETVHQTLRVCLFMATNSSLFHG